MKLFRCPQPGRRILHIACSELRSHSIEAVTQICLELGFSPDVEYQLQDGKVNLILVLANEPVEHDFGESFDAIAERLDDDWVCLHALGWSASMPLPAETVAA